MSQGTSSGRPAESCSADRQALPTQVAGILFPRTVLPPFGNRILDKPAHSQLREEAGVDRGEANYQRQWTVHTGVFTKQPLSEFCPISTGPPGPGHRIAHRSLVPALLEQESLCDGTHLDPPSGEASSISM